MHFWRRGSHLVDAGADAIADGNVDQLDVGTCTMFIAQAL